MPIVADIPRGIDRVIAAAQHRLPLAFFGTPSFAVPSLRALVADGWPIGMVVTAPAKPAGRRMQVSPSPIATVADELGLPIQTPQHLKDDPFSRAFAELRPELCVVVAYGKLIPDSILSAPKLGFVNVHPSLLPAYRGPTPIQSAILDGCTETGVSIMLLDDQVDHGPVLARSRWAIPSGFDAPTCADELSRLGAELLTATLNGYVDGSVAPEPQDHAAATFTRKFTRQDGHLDWSDTAVSLVNRVRALAREPGTWVSWSGRTLAVLYAHATEAHGDRAAGSVYVRGHDVCVSARDGSVVLETVRPEGGRDMPVAAFVSGHPTFIGSIVQ